MQIDYSAEVKKNLAKLARRYRRIRQDVQPVIETLIAGQTPGDQVPGVGYPTYKVRIKNSDAARGTSGGYRLLYYLRTSERILLVTLYSKSDAEDVPPDVLRRLIEEHLAAEADQQAPPAP